MLNIYQHCVLFKLHQNTIFEKHNSNIFFGSEIKKMSSIQEITNAEGKGFLIGITFKPAVQENCVSHYLVLTTTDPIGNSVLYSPRYMI